MVMIDWVTCKIPFFYEGIISDGELLNVTRDGEVSYSVRKRRSFRGSYDGAITLRTAEVDDQGNTIKAELSGNPVKFLQGHNLFGSDDLLNLVLETVYKLSGLLNYSQPDWVLNLLISGSYTISRVDINRMFSLSNRAEVLSYLYSLSASSRTLSQSAVTSGSTVYLNKSSRRWSFKFYSKAQEVELKRNRAQGCLELPQGLRDWVEPMLRAELTLKSNELRELQLHRAANWNTIETQSLFADYAERIQMSEQKINTDIQKLTDELRPKAALATYHLWKDGHDVRRFLPQNTFYRHRRALKAFGVDVSMPPPKPDSTASNVVPFCKTLELRAAVLPDWVSGTDYLFEPRMLCKLA